MTTSILRVDNLSIFFGGIKALQDVTFNVQRGTITSMIGPNGAGKTTVFNCLTGFYKAGQGSIHLNTHGREHNVVQMLGENLHLNDVFSPDVLLHKLYYKAFGGTHLVNRAGLARTFQNIRLFREMTVIENLLVAQHMSINRNLIAGIIETKAFRQSESQARDRAYQLLDEFHLGDEANRIAGELPYGKQRRLEIARAMCTRPEIICLDEPAAGLNPRETQELSQMIIGLKQKGVTVLLIEHDMRLVMEISDYIVVLDHGEVIARGTPNEIRSSPKVIQAYLGTDEEAVA